MNVVVVGAGALGSIIAAYLARGGHDVSLIARGERAEQLARHGVIITGREDFVAPCTIVTAPETLQQTDVVIVAVKTYDTDAALAPLANLKAKSVFSVQNGVLKNDQLSAVFGEQATLGAVGMLGGEVLASEGDQPGPVRYLLDGAIVVGERAGGHSDRVSAIVDALSGAGLNASSSEVVQTVEWSKFVGWSGFSALAVLTRLPTYQFLSDADTARLAARVMRETGEVATCLGVTLQDSGPLKAHSVTAGTEDEAVQVLQAMGETFRQNAPGFRQSILQDADRGRRLEVNETLGHTLRLAAEHGVPTPTLEFCCRILRTVDRTATPR